MKYDYTAFLKPVDTGRLDELIQRLVTATGRARRSLLEDDIPDEMAEQRLWKFIASDGTQVRRKTVVRGAIRAGKEAEARAWLKSRGYRPPRTTRKQGRGTNAMSSFIRKLVQAGEALPPEELMSTSIWSIARIYKGG